MRRRAEHLGEAGFIDRPFPLRDHNRRKAVADQIHKSKSLRKLAVYSQDQRDCGNPNYVRCAQCGG